MNRIPAYFNVSSAQAIVFIILLILLVKLQLVISRTESQLTLEKARGSNLNKYLDSLETYLLHENTTTQSIPFQHPDTITRDSNKKRPPQDSRPAVNVPDTSNKSFISITSPRRDSVKTTFNFSGSYDQRIEVNKLFSIERIDLTLALSRYDSMYQYTVYLGLTNWKLIFTQRMAGKNATIISEFRIKNALVDNNSTVTCQFVEELPDYTFTTAARVVNFKGVISNSGITGELSWIDKTFGRLVPLTIPLTLTRSW